VLVVLVSVVAVLCVAVVLVIVAVVLVELVVVLVFVVVVVELLVVVNVVVLVLVLVKLLVEDELIVLVFVDVEGDIVLVRVKVVVTFIVLVRVLVAVDLFGEAASAAAVELGGTQCTSEGGSSSAEVAVVAVRVTVPPLAGEIVDAAVPSKLVSTAAAGAMANLPKGVEMLLLLLLRLMSPKMAPSLIAETMVVLVDRPYTTPSKASLWNGRL